MSINNTDKIRHWTEHEEIELIKLIRDKIPIKNIEIKLNRHRESIIIRLQKIIYENIINNGETIKFVSSLLNLSEVEILNHVKSYKEYKKKHENEASVDKYHDIYLKEHINPKDLNLKMEIIERENKFMELILKNRALHNQIDNLIKKGKIDKNINNIIKNMRI
jgi:hypothetical protein